MCRPVETRLHPVGCRCNHGTSFERNIKEAAPEFRDAGGNVRIIKVLVEIEAQHLSKTDGHIGISAEIEIQLQCICANGKPGSHKEVVPED